MLKVLLHGTCSYDCAYCSIHLQRARLSFSPGERGTVQTRLFP